MVDQIFYDYVTIRMVYNDIRLPHKTWLQQSKSGIKTTLYEQGGIPYDVGSHSLRVGGVMSLFLDVYSVLIV